VLLVYRNRGTSDVDKLTDLADREEKAEAAA
jgi:hypothetical protein